jgi:hypothetical protein
VIFFGRYTEEATTDLTDPTSSVFFPEKKCFFSAHGALLCKKIGSRVKKLKNPENPNGMQSAFISRDSRGRGVSSRRVASASP